MCVIGCVCVCVYDVSHEYLVNKLEVCSLSILPPKKKKKKKQFNLYSCIMMYCTKVN